MKFRLPLLICLVFALVAVACPLARAADASDETRAATEFFENQIRPVLASRCYDCHGAKKQKSGLRLDTFVGFSKGGEGGALVVAGKQSRGSRLRSRARPM